MAAHKKCASAALILGAVAVALSGCGGGGGTTPKPGPPGPTPAPPGPPPPPPKYWLVCNNMDTCGKDASLLTAWNTDPSKLADSIGDISKLPGIDDTAWSTFASMWSASPPTFKKSPVKLTDIAAFMKDLMTSDPFGSKDMVPYMSFSRKKDGQSIALTQRQMAYIVSNVLMGNSLQQGTDGLTAALGRCPGKHQDIMYTLLSLLAVLSRELKGGLDGTVLIAARPKDIAGKPHGSIGWKDRFSNVIKAPNICNKVGDVKSGCTPDDFMTSGNAFQALTDIAGEVVGGGGQLCNIATSQDESLVQFYSEVLAFAFFSDSMVPVPVTFLGTRRYVNNIEGNRVRQCGEIAKTNWLNDDIETTTTSVVIDPGDGAEHITMMTDSFVAIKSVCSAAFAGKCSHVNQMNNNCDSQRHHVDQDIDFWYQAFEPTFYHPTLLAAYTGVIKSIGTGPWGSGVWFGDSQIYFLTMLLATNLLKDTKLDYYIYEAFCENGGNQCFILAKDECQKCLAMKRAEGPGLDASFCGKASYTDILKMFEGKTAGDMYKAIMAVKGPPGQCFDNLPTNSSIIFS